jgi:hypothetical protein
MAGAMAKAVPKAMKAEKARGSSPNTPRYAAMDTAEAHSMDITPTGLMSGR